MENQTTGQFSAETLAWLETADLKARQALGQFMTPRLLREQLLEKLDMKSGDRVLDPAVGTGEFLRDALSQYPGIQVFGWDVDPKILVTAQSLVPEAQLSNRSALDPYVGDKFDFVIGNPPYFELKLQPNEKAQFQAVINGRPNIYSLFFKVGLDALKEGGKLAYVVPPSMNTGAYFQNLRRFLTEQNHIKSLQIFSDSSLFVDAQTAVQIIVVEKGPGISENTFCISDESSGVQSLVLCENPDYFRTLYEGCVSLSSLGFEAVTGTTVWNQNKSKLVNIEDDQTVPLIYARNLVDGGIKLSPDPRRPQFIRGGKTMTGEAILVNRIIGGVGKGIIKASLVPDGYRFAAENHLNVIRPISGLDQKMSIGQLFEIITAPETMLKARTLSGNTQLSAKEWTYLMPIPYPIQT